MSYVITVTILDKDGAGTKDTQYVKIKGTQGSTAELTCTTNFDVKGQDVSCTVESSAIIGHYECISWRTAGDDPFAFNKVTFLK